MESRLAAPAELAGAGDRTASTKALRISTGVVAPKLIHSTDVALDNNSSLSYSGPRHVVVGMIVGKDGVPSDLHIVESAGVLVDRNVLAAVSLYRFAPGTVSNQPTEVPLNLDITLVGAAR
ncbi:MAG: energy transducer TonB [Edaphobacter sp.]|uniref:energy transducer TonB n=1 Tax=Edaphobacter sp. TaxID=1934404 RepID=UPI002391508A|nr:energy transducer TonB [Edaphobacter sp.]MDE1177212.1 energy transducer TonB [Edaphobacter sp.]